MDFVTSFNIFTQRKVINLEAQKSISSTFYALVFCTKVLFCQNVTREKKSEALLHKKRERKMLMKLKPACTLHLQTVSIQFFSY